VQRARPERYLFDISAFFRRYLSFLKFCIAGAFNDPDYLLFQDSGGRYAQSATQTRLQVWPTPNNSKFRNTNLFFAVLGLCDAGSAFDH
jgi:hypothetical protein